VPESSIETEIGDLLRAQKYAVLSTQEDEHPYLNLVAFAETDNLCTILFATTKETRKFGNLLSHSGVALLVDNRSNDAADIRQATAVTIIGQANEVARVQRERLDAVYLAKLPHMEPFLSSPSTALIRIDVASYVLVRNFQDVRSLQMSR
jgi:nitroimidazol reductase NimA-like FMN-containing flavoprotein (pyridoxamine 5'-phosphate oxidase superfamily)